jgi:hypothetical protein
MLNKEEEHNGVSEGPTTSVAKQVAPDVVIDEVDFNELLEYEKAARNTEEQLNKLSGSMFRLTKDQELLYNHEKKVNAEIELKRKDLIKRYKLDEQKSWKIDINSRKVIYS